MELKLSNVKVLHSRVELLKPEQLFSTVITRAFASMAEILKLTGQLQAENGLLLAMKGQKPDLELAELTTKYAVIPIKVPGIEAERCLISMERG